MSIIEYANVTNHRIIKQTGDGYGDKLPTAHQVQLNGSSKWRNVFAICWGNAASFYVLVNGERKFVSDASLDSAKGTL